ncbi:ribosomal protein S18 acetylase RimI-like enzyme [Kribbella aluminosa]|uniref:Ribosomal protein S18 acetylase RimI-like enzyme n=1 Tax=Kribbella aluminosa TaxID=416017 RepID=A0ABS4UKY8_9ACTN|nr:GNAT family N-acetyltransferase [Kribbella aluminosa]MBP2352310.1 ribosomal protein S18 acetylase RimI-like enzyme [Kribbella aluminosa]
MKVREATNADVDAAVDTLTQALLDYPMTRACLDPDGYVDRLTQYHRLFVGAIGIPHGRVWVTDDVRAVAIWFPPDMPAEVFAPHAAAFQDLAGSRAGPTAEYGQAIALFHPRHPSWLLALAAVHPDHQRQGLGHAVIEPGLAVADAAHSPTFVETQDPANVGFYESFGFTVIAELELPHNGPMHYALYRPAQP